MKKIFTASGQYSDEFSVGGETVAVPRFAPGSWYELDNPEFI